MELFVPGRICLFGEHSDWAGGYRRENSNIEKGYTLIAGVNQGIYARIEPRPDHLYLTATTHSGERFGPRSIPLQPEALLAEANQGGFWSYTAGVAYQVLQQYPTAGGLAIDNYRTTLPIKKGLSSSAAICVLAARAFNRVYDLGLSIRDEMELAYLGEITTPSRCGRMDQGLAFGECPVLMTFDGDDLDVQELTAGADIPLVIVDLHAAKDTQKILADLNKAYPVAQDSIHRGVQDLLGPLNKGIVHQAVDAITQGDNQRIGQLMVEAQELFDRYAAPACPEELTAPVLHRALNHAALKPHIWGCKGIGSQGDGTAQFLARSKADQDSLVEIIERELAMSAMTLTIKVSVPV